MIASATPASREHYVPEWHERFLQMLPAITRQARLAIRHLAPEAAADMVEEVVVNAFVAWRPPHG
jgi:hypothetical protein